MKIKGIHAEVSELARLYMNGKTLQDIGDMYGVTREAIRLIFCKAGLNVRDMKSYYKLQEREKCKMLADKVLLKTANDSIKTLVEEKRVAETNVRALKQYRIEIIGSFRNTLFKMREKIYSAELGKKSPSVVLDDLLEMLSIELENLNKYRGLIRGIEK